MQETVADPSAQPRNLTPEELALLVRTLREAKRWSQEQLADIAKVSVRTVQRVEEGQSSSIDTRRALASALGFEDIDALNKPYAIPTAAQLAKQQAKFDAEHLTLTAQRIETGKQLGRMVEQCSALLFHDGVDLSAEPAEEFARLTDYCRDYADCDDLYSAVDKLAVYEELGQMVNQLANAGFTLVGADRASHLLPKSPKDELPISILYVVAARKGQEPEQLVVTRKVQFA